MNETDERTAQNGRGEAVAKVIRLPFADTTPEVSDTPAPEAPRPRRRPAST